MEGMEASATMKRSRHAFTLVEILVVLAVVGVLITVISTLLSQGGLQEARLRDTEVAIQDLRLALQRMTHEIRESHRLFYPQSGGISQPGVGFVDPRGHAILYYVPAASTTEIPGDGGWELKRRDVNEGTEETVARGIHRFRVTVPEVAAGREPASVNIHLATATGTTGRIKTSAVQSLVTSVYLRAAHSRCAEWSPIE